MQTRRKGRGAFSDTSFLVNPNLLKTLSWPRVISGLTALPYHLTAGFSQSLHHQILHVPVSLESSSIMHIVPRIEKYVCRAMIDGIQIQ